MTFLKLSQAYKVEDAADLVDFSGFFRSVIVGNHNDSLDQILYLGYLVPRFLVDGSVLAVDEAPLLLLLLSFICIVSCFRSIFCFGSVNSYTKQYLETFALEHGFA